MKVTSIKQQLKRMDRYSIFIDGRYAFSLSDSALLDKQVMIGQEFTDKQFREFKQSSIDDKLYDATLRYLALRSRSQWEIEQYLKRKKASPSLINVILNKLSKLTLIDDMKFAEAYISDRQLLRPTSSRKIILELRQKHIEDDIIKQAMARYSPINEQEALQIIIEKKRRLSRYQNDLKLMQYLARQGFKYNDIKFAIKDS